MECRVRVCKELSSFLENAFDGGTLSVESGKRHAQMLHCVESTLPCTTDNGQQNTECDVFLRRGWDPIGYVVSKTASEIRRLLNYLIAATATRSI